MKVAAALSIGMVLATSASAGRLCRDLRGLYTPCLEALGHDRGKNGNAAKASAANDAPPAVASRSPAARPLAASSDRPTKPPLFSTGHLCRDSKGLATPCVK